MHENTIVLAQSDHTWHTTKMPQQLFVVGDVFKVSFGEVRLSKEEADDSEELNNDADERLVEERYASSSGMYTRGGDV